MQRYSAHARPVVGHTEPDMHTRSDISEYFQGSDYGEVIEKCYKKHSRRRGIISMTTTHNYTSSVK